MCIWNYQLVEGSFAEEQHEPGAPRYFGINTTRDNQESLLCAQVAPHKIVIVCVNETPINLDA